jgi:hypothetical protein
MSVTVVIAGMEHVIDEQTWTGPLAARLDELTAPFAAGLGGETPWPDYAIAEYVVRVVRGAEITQATPDVLPEGVVF